ncbi:MAG: TIGR03668 family PPOX class F420-dependent oxidoreductase, partial [Acidimicrobiales bacterium]
RDRIDLVPCCFALVDVGFGPDGEMLVELVTAVDHKPKSTSRLARLANIERNENASLLVDHRDAEDWSRLWWVRVSGSARVVTGGDDWANAIEALVDKYPSYQKRAPEGPVIRLAIDRWSGWQSSQADQV